MWPGHHINPGTRQTASNGDPFSPRNGCVPASGQASCQAPLSAVMITMVLGAFARITSMIDIRPVLLETSVCFGQSAFHVLVMFFLLVCARFHETKRGKSCHIALRC